MRPQSMVGGEWLVVSFPPSSSAQGTGRGGDRMGMRGHGRWGRRWEVEQDSEMEEAVLSSGVPKEGNKPPTGVVKEAS